MIDFKDNETLQDFLELALSQCNSVIKRGTNKWNFRCPICLDSQKSLKKRRAWILKNNKNVWIFNCFNCGMGSGAGIWLKMYFPEIYRDYIKCLLQKSKPKIIKKIEPVIPEKKVESKESRKYPFQKITDRDSVIIKDAIKYCEERRIPRDIYLGFFVCESEKYFGRLIIPYYNKEGKIYYFAARSLYLQEPKYLFSEGEKQLYNLYNVDEKEPVVICEGMIDSIFFTNSIGIGGLQLSDEQNNQLSKFKNRHYLMDSDEAGRKKSIKLLKDGNSVFLWKKFLKDNELPEQKKYDLNSVYIKLNRTKNFSYEELKKYFTNNYLNSVWLR